MNSIIDSAIKLLPYYLLNLSFLDLKKETIWENIPFMVKREYLLRNFDNFSEFDKNKIKQNIVELHNKD